MLISVALELCYVLLFHIRNDMCYSFGSFTTWITYYYIPKDAPLYAKIALNPGGLAINVALLYLIIKWGSMLLLKLGNWLHPERGAINESSREHI